MWRSLSLRADEVNLALILPKGQSFRWRCCSDGSWLGVFQRRAWLLRQTDSQINYRVVCGPKTSPKDCEALLRDYFNLDGFSLPHLYSQWAKTIPGFPAKVPGVRVLRQDPVETLFAFICSSNNNISRISSMVEKLCSQFGPAIGTFDGQELHDFPAVASLAEDGVEAKLRQLGFGYRAKFIERSAKQLEARGGAAWLQGLRAASYEDAASQLLQLQGVGRKVADCVCLMALDKAEAVPVDTHVLQVSLRLHPQQLRPIFPAGPPKSLSDAGYRAIGEALRKVWEPLPGWAQAVLFCADLQSTKLETAQQEEEPARKRKR